MIEEEANRAGEDEDDDGEHSAYPTAWDMNDCVWVAFGGVIHGMSLILMKGVLLFFHSGSKAR
jgi:hypothetical protein|eukprot:m.300037 g.300037  ORF g.300037 m.300037 type:complete len:63 (-) comp27244_c2_seq1:561-749(-)